MTEPTSSFSRRSLGRLAAGAGVALAAPAVIGHAEPASLHIAQLQSLTGPSAAYGLKSRDGTLLAMEDLNATGVEIGGTTYKIVMPVDDMANDARQAVTLLRQYASDASVVCVLGPTNSVGYLPIIPAAAQLEIPVVCNGSGAPVKEWNPWTCRVNLVSAVATPVMLTKLKASLGFKKVAVIYDQTQDSQRGDAEFTKANAGKIGYDIVAYEAFRANDQDFSAQISTMRAAKPDAIWVAAATGDGVRVVSQIREAGMAQPLMTGNGSFQDPVYWDGTKGQVIDCYCWIGLDLSNPSPALKSFAERYKTRFGMDPIAFSDYGVSSVYAVVEALKKAGKIDRHALQAALADLDITTPTGTRVTFKNPPTGENLNASTYVAKITGRGSYSSPDHVLAVQGLTKRFGGLTAVDAVDFAVAPGQVVSVVGPNGAGKTTLFNLITGVIRPDAGRVVFAGQDVTGRKPHALARLGMARTFQNIRLFGHLNAIENVMIGLVARTAGGVFDALFCTRRDRDGRRKMRDQAEALLDWVGVGDNRTRLPAELPYGDQRRVEIARALGLDPKLLILDEPTAGMVAQEAHAVIDLIARLRQRGTALMLVEHNMNVVMSASDHIVVVNFGQKIAEGAPAAIRADPRVIEAYLGVDD